MSRLFRLTALTLALLLALSSLAFAEIEACPPVETGILDILKYGNIMLEISGDALLDLGYEYGDIINADICGRTLEMPLCANYADVDVGAMALRVISSKSGETSRAILGINAGDLTTWLGLAERSEIGEDPGYCWDFAEPYEGGVTISLSLKEKGGYLDKLGLNQTTISTKREDYPNLTDEAYANFRNVATTGMGANVLYRSSSPVNPRYNRNREADAAVNAAGIRTVMNMADSENAMKSYEDYAYTYYSKLDVIPLDMVVGFGDEEFQARLAEGFRFLASHEAPYLIHCSLGKDRAGFASAVLECLMGATADEVVEDYLVSYYNYYGVEPGSKRWKDTASANILKFLPEVFGISDLETADLAATAEAFLLKIGMTEDEISALKTRLGTDIK